MSETVHENEPNPNASDKTENNDQEQAVKIKPMRLNRTQKKLIKFERIRANARQKKEESKLKKRLAKGDVPKISKPTEYATPYVKMEGFINRRDQNNLNKERLRQVYADNSNNLKVLYK